MSRAEEVPNAKRDGGKHDESFPIWNFRTNRFIRFTWQSQKCLRMFGELLHF
jgi:hypothetical protein